MNGQGQYPGSQAGGLSARYYPGGDDEYNMPEVVSPLPQRLVLIFPFSPGMG